MPKATAGRAVKHLGPWQSPERSASCHAVQQVLKQRMLCSKRKTRCSSLLLNLEGQGLLCPEPNPTKKGRFENDQHSSEAKCPKAPAALSTTRQKVPPETLLGTFPVSDCSPAVRDAEEQRRNQQQGRGEALAWRTLSLEGFQGSLAPFSPFLRCISVLLVLFSFNFSHPQIQEERE